jgi:voltage-gated potassium channel
VSGDVPDAARDSALEKLFYHRDHVRFIYWRQFSGAKPTVLLTGVITVLSFVTGLSNLSQPTLVLNGPLAGVLPGAALYAQFAGVLFAFGLGIVTVFLQRRKRLAWYGAVILLPLLAVLPLTTLQTTDVPLLVLVLVTEPLLVWNRDRFDQSLDLSPLQVASLLSIFGVVAYGAVGSYALREDFTAIETVSDAVYYVIVTIATVGYGDITPLSPEARWFSLSVILLGTGAFTAAIGALVVPAIESRMAAAFGNMTASELKLLEDHVLVLGYGDVTESLLDELDGEADLVVVTPDADIAADLKDDGVKVLTDDPTDEDVLLDVRIDEARGVVVATRDDARDVLTVLAAREANPDIRIVAAANREKHADKLQRVGADEVISPMSIAGRLLGQSVLGESTTTSRVADDGATDTTGPASGLADGVAGDGAAERPDAALLELHGSLFRVQCTACSHRADHREPVDTSSREVLPRCPECDALLRPDVVWFGESLDRTVLEEAIARADAAEACLVVGTSAVVQPAASLATRAARVGAALIEVNPESTPLTRSAKHVFRGDAAKVVPALLGRADA